MEQIIFGYLCFAVSCCNTLFKVAPKQTNKQQPNPPLRWCSLPSGRMSYFLLGSSMLTPSGSSVYPPPFLPPSLSLSPPPSLWSAVSSHQQRDPAVLVPLPFALPTSPTGCMRGRLTCFPSAIPTVFSLMVPPPLFSVIQRSISTNFTRFFWERSYHLSLGRQPKAQTCQLILLLYNVFSFTAQYSRSRLTPFFFYFSLIHCCFKSF